jgi:hypothetical protein
MATLVQPTVNKNPFADRIGDHLAPVGTYVATLVDIKDQFGVERLKYQSEEKEKVDLTCFLFGFRDHYNQPHLVASKQMKISGNEKSALFKFLKSLMGKAPPYNWDYCQLKGTKCLLTVEHVQKRDGSGVYAAIASQSPLPEGYVGNRPPVAPQPPAPVPAAPPIHPAPSPVIPPHLQVQDDDLPF